MLRYVLFDLDNTLYPPESGLWQAIGKRIELYLTDRMHLPLAEATALRGRYFKTFGTTLNGLRVEYAIDPLEYLDFVHDLPLAHYLTPLPALDAMLERLPQTKAIFTNADALHARRVLAQLGIDRHFTQIIDILTLEFLSKPDPRAYQRALALLSAAPAECLFVEDTPQNLPPAHDLGMRTVLLGQRVTERGIDHQIDHILDLEGVLAATR
jgi:putative hydrolase of the HAD superfamily